MKTANCPSCGAGIVFQSAVSLLAVCEYCKSTLIRHDLELENIGKMAELLTDSSPVQLRAQGCYRGERFTVLGRIQLRYAQGVWNEWYLLFENQRDGWLGETLGNYVVTFLRRVSGSIPPFAELRAGLHMQLGSRTYEVTDLESAVCVAGEGELPASIRPGYAAPVVDLQGVGLDNAFATLDYSEDPPLVYIGEHIDFKELQFTGLRDLQSPYGKSGALPGQPAPAKPRVKTFRCPSCGASLQIRAEGTEALACGSCGSILDIRDENHQILSRYQAKIKHKPLIPLGSQGKLFGEDYSVIGYLRRQVKVEGVNYEWCEYLLWNTHQGFRWLVEYQGHWNFSKTTTYPPKRLNNAEPPELYYEGRTYRHFQSAVARVTYVLGEFYWRVQVGEQCETADYVDPPFMLSRELTGNESIWSVAEYIEPQVLWAALKLKKPMPLQLGVAPNQPYPEVGRARNIGRLCKAFLALLIVLQGGFLLASQNRLVFQQKFQFEQTTKDKTLTSDPFELTGHPANIVIKSSGNVNNNWLYLDMALINRDTGESYQVGREISYYQGVEEGERWTEGSPEDEAILSHIPAGHYYLSIEPESQANNVAYTLEVYRDVPNWSNFFIALAALLSVPLVAWWRRRSFEYRRWSESDHPPASSGDDDDDE